MGAILFCSRIWFVREKCLSRKSAKFFGLADKQTFVALSHISTRSTNVIFMIVSKPSFILTNDVDGLTFYLGPYFQ